MQNLSFLAFTVVMFQDEVLWVLTPYIVVVGYRRFRGTRCLGTFGTSVSYPNTARHHKPEDLDFIHCIMCISLNLPKRFSIIWHYKIFSGRVSRNIGLSSYKMSSYIYLIHKLCMYLVQRSHERPRCIKTNGTSVMG